MDQCNYHECNYVSYNNMDIYHIIDILKKEKFEPSV